MQTVVRVKRIRWRNFQVHEHTMRLRDLPIGALFMTRRELRSARMLGWHLAGYCIRGEDPYKSVHVLFPDSPTLTTPSQRVHRVTFIRPE